MNIDGKSRLSKKQMYQRNTRFVASVKNAENALNSNLSDLVVITGDDVNPATLTVDGHTYAVFNRRFGVNKGLEVSPRSVETGFSTRVFDNLETAIAYMVEVAEGELADTVNLYSGLVDGVQKKIDGYENWMKRKGIK